MSKSQREQLIRKLQWCMIQRYQFLERADEARMNRGGHIAAGHERTAALYYAAANQIAKQLGIE